MVVVAGTGTIGGGAIVIVVAGSGGWVGVEGALSSSLTGVDGATTGTVAGATTTTGGSSFCGDRGDDEEEETGAAVAAAAGVPRRDELRFQSSTEERVALFGIKVKGSTSTLWHIGHSRRGEATRCSRMHASQNVSEQHGINVASRSSPWHSGHCSSRGTLGACCVAVIVGVCTPSTFAATASNACSFGRMTAKPPPGCARGARIIPARTSSFSRVPTG